MSKKKNRAWFVCPQYTALIGRYYPDDVAAARALRVDPKILGRLRERTPVAKSILRRVLRRLATQHLTGSPVDELIVDTRAR